MQLPLTVHPQSRIRGKRASQQRCIVMVTKSDRTSWWIGIERPDTSRKSVGWTSFERQATPSAITTGLSMDEDIEQEATRRGGGKTQMVLSRDGDLSQATDKTISCTSISAFSLS